MPSPIGHLLGGAAVYLAATGPRGGSRMLLACALSGSVAPDLDFLPGILIGDPGAFHHGISHSLAFAGLFGAMAYLVLRWSHSQSAVEGALMAGFAYAFHITLDVISVTVGRGMPIFWPLSSERFGFDFLLFGHFHHYRLQHGLWSIVRWENLPAVTRELLVTGIPVALLLLWRRRRRSQGDIQWEA